MNDIKNYLNNLKCPDKITDRGLVIESPPEFRQREGSVLLEVESIGRPTAGGEGE